MAKHILDIVDMQFDFTKKNGKLPVPWADALNDKANDCKAFPHIHCEHGTQGWELSVDAGLLKGKMPVWYMAKNVFDMWNQNPVKDQSKLKFNNDNEAKAYANLFHVTDGRRRGCLCHHAGRRVGCLRARRGARVFAARGAGADCRGSGDGDRDIKSGPGL
jgi:hypothetical protein